jgi:hypothetical protein
MSHPERSTLRPWSDLCLYVIGGVPRVVPLQEGISIGRDPNNTVIIDHPDVRPFHATVWRCDEQLVLTCANAAGVLLCDGTEVSRLMLIEGTRCRVGDAVVTCAAGTSIDDADAICARCGRDLAALPIGRRFCPRCGLNVSVRPVPVLDPLQDNPLPPREPSHSLIVAGYATAMNKLGTRYEVGHGVHRNEDEAVRCYGKAARLGNEDARVRLGRWGQE